MPHRGARGQVEPKLGKRHGSTACGRATATSDEQEAYSVACLKQFGEWIVGPEDPHEDGAAIPIGTELILAGL